MKKLENKISGVLNRFPVLKKIIKRLYQYTFYIFSKKIRKEGNIIRVSPNDEKEYFFGYYDKSPWDKENRYILSLRVNNTYKKAAYTEEAEIVLIDTWNKNKIEILTTTNSWNVQQGCMLQWLGPIFNKKIIYNDFKDGKYCSFILDIETKEKRKIDFPIYTVSKDGKIALSLDFSRLHRLRKGYGYANLLDKTINKKLPDEVCIWKIDLEDNKIIPLLKYTDFYNFETKKEMIGAEHKVNHLMLNPTGDRFMVLHRWFQQGRKYTRLLTIDIDGKNFYNLSDDGMVSHCFWKNDNEIFAYEYKKNIGNGYFLMQDKTNKSEHYWKNIVDDGHPSFSPNGKIILSDTYPNKKRISKIFITEENDIKGERIKVLAQVFSPFRYDNEVRCDLHPRWSRDGKKICFDATFEGKRKLYVINC